MKPIEARAVLDTRHKRRCGIFCPRPNPNPVRMGHEHDGQLDGDVRFRAFTPPLISKLRSLGYIEHG